MSQSKKQTFLHGAALLALATAIVKVVGAFYKIPLKMIIADQGFGYFNTAYNIYAVLLMISTAGLPIAMSRMISQSSSTGNYNQVRRVYATARGIFLGLGIASSLLHSFIGYELFAEFLSVTIPTFRIDEQYVPGVRYLLLRCLYGGELLRCLRRHSHGYQ